MRDGVLDVLAEHFPQVPVVDSLADTEGQGPCLILSLWSAAQDRETGHRYKRGHTFDILYVKGQGESGEAQLEVYELLFNQLTQITVDGSLLKGSKLRCETVTGALHFRVDYDFHIMVERQQGPVMQHLKAEVELRNGK
ncbi:DUF6838 family protein [Paenibacillus sp. GCM10012307]